MECIAPYCARCVFSFATHVKVVAIELQGPCRKARWVAHVSDRACGWADVLDESDDGQDEYRMHNQDPGEDRPTSKNTTFVAPNWDEATLISSMSSHPYILANLKEQYTRGPISPQ